MELLSQNVNTIRSKMLPMEETIVVPIGDIHYGSSECDVDRLQKLVNWGMTQKNVYFLGMGDYFDFTPSSVRGQLNKITQDDRKYEMVNDILDEAVRKKLDELYKILEKTKGRWIGMIGGNHSWTFSDGTNTDTVLCQKLGTAYLGTVSMIQLKFKSSGNYKNMDCVIWATHGTSTSNPIQKLEKLSGYFDADVFLMGHNHRKEAKKKVYLTADFVSNKLKQKVTIIASTGGFLKGYKVGSKLEGIPCGNYVERGLYNPLPLGTCYIYIRPYSTRNNNGIDLDVLI